MNDKQIVDKMLNSIQGGSDLKRVSAVVMSMGQETVDIVEALIIRAYRMGYADGQAKAHLKESHPEEV